MDSADRHNGGFDNPDGRRIDTAAPQSSSMSFLKKFAAPFAALALVASSASCTRDDLQNARTQVARTTPTDPSDTPDENPAFDPAPFAGLNIMTKDPITGQFYVMLGVNQGASINTTYKILDKDGNVLATITDTVDSGRKINQDGVFSKEKKLASWQFDVLNADSIQLDTVDNNGQPKSITRPLEEPTSVAHNDND